MTSYKDNWEFWKVDVAKVDQKLNSWLDKAEEEINNLKANLLEPKLLPLNHVQVMTQVLKSLQLWRPLNALVRTAGFQWTLSV